ncbi:MAG: hypothetical protein ABFS34_06225 [Gemmatimonadota bacterium]
MSVPRSVPFPCRLAAVGLGLAMLAAPPHVFAQEQSALRLVAEAREATDERDWGRAAVLWDSVTRANPTRAEYWGRLARAKRESGDYAAAIAALEREGSLGGRAAPDITFDIARSHGAAGRPGESLRWLERAYETGLRHHRTARSDTAFAALRRDARYRALAGLVDSAEVSRVEGWRTDVRFLARSLEYIHYDLFDNVSPEVFSAFVDRLIQDIPRLSDRQIVVRLMRLTRMAGDAHTNLFPEHVFRSTREGVPATFFKYADGLYVQSASAAHGALVGREVVAVAGRDPIAVLDSVGQIVSRDNPMWVDLTAANLISFPQILEGLGLAPSPARLELTVRDDGGPDETVVLQVTPGPPDSSWVDVWPDHLLRGRTPQLRYWFEELPELGAAYFQFNLVFNDSEEPLPDFLDRMFAELDARGVGRLIIDLRENRGGNVFLADKLLHHLISRPRFHEPGSLYVIAGRKTFSAAMYTAAQMERHLDPIFVGEPTGSRPNFVGETVYIRLPYSGLEPSISNLYWQGTHGADNRTWIGPHLYAPPSIEHLREGSDPALEAIRVDIRGRE